MYPVLFFFLKHVSSVKRTHSLYEKELSLNWDKHGNRITPNIKRNKKAKNKLK